MWAVKVKAAGEAPAECNRITPGDPLPAGFDFITETNPNGKVVADDEVSLRDRTAAELEALAVAGQEDALLQAVEARMDWEARTKGGSVAAGYQDRYTCAARAGYPGPWQAEGLAFGEWMDNWYAYLYQVQADVLAGTRSAPSKEELIIELETAYPMVWP